MARVSVVGVIDCMPALTTHPTKADAPLWYDTFVEGLPHASLASFIDAPREVNALVESEGGRVDVLAADVPLFRLSEVTSNYSNLVGPRIYFVLIGARRRSRRAQRLPVCLRPDRGSAPCIAAR